MFWSIFQIIFTILIVCIIYQFWYLFQIRKKLSWLPSTPLLPLLGSALEFGRDTREFLGNLQRLSNNNAKSFYFELGFQHGVVTKDHEFMEFLLSSNKMEILNKSNDYKIFEPWLGTGLLTATGPKWKKRRRIITPAFHFSILEQFVDVFETNGNILIKKIKDEAVNTDVVNIYKYIRSCTLDIISESAMGVSIKSQAGSNNDYVSSVKDMCRILVTRAFSPFVRYEYIFRLTEDYRKSQRHLKVLHEFTNSVINNKIKELGNKNNQESEDDSTGKKRRLAFLDLILNSTVDGKPLSKEDIREEVDTFMFEGHDTTSFAVSMTLFLLANHQDVQELARSEQKEIFVENRDKPSTLQDLNDMKYLDLVIKESLRLYPSVPIIGRQIIDDVEYHGNIIPKDTPITLFIYGINRDPNYHEKPEEFIPERHLTSNRKYFSNIPFSAGPRNCIGQKFAVLVMKSIISKMLRNFNLLPTNPAHKPILAMEAVFKPTNGINIRIKNYEWK